MNSGRCSQMSSSWKSPILEQTWKSFSRKVCGPGFSVIKNQTVRPTKIILGRYWPIRNVYISKTKLWENNQHFESSPLVSPRNDVWGTSTEIPYWWRLTTQIWMFISATCTNIRETFVLLEDVVGHWFKSSFFSHFKICMSFLRPYVTGKLTLNVILKAWDVRYPDSWHLPPIITPCLGTISSSP